MSVTQIGRVALAAMISLVGIVGGGQVEGVAWQPGVECPRDPQHKGRHGSKRLVGRKRRRRCKPKREKQEEEATKESNQKEPAGETPTQHEGWMEAETMAAELKDKRLNKRLTCLVEQFAAQPTASIPQACGSWASTKAAYNFFNNKRVSREGILEGHKAKCIERIEAAEAVLILQDTTELDYSHHPQTEGLGTLACPSHQGFIVHNTFVISTDGEPLGLLDQQVWTRDPAEQGSRYQRKNRPIEEKESYKWLKGLRASLKSVPNTACIITVVDREADVYELFQEADNQNTSLLVRNSWNRRLDGDAKDYIWEAVSRAPVRETFSVEVGRAKDRLPRRAQVELRFTELTLRPPKRSVAARSMDLQPQTLTAIEVREVDPPSKKDALHWLLLTNLSIASVADARRCVRWYALRWLVERYHYVLKSGCKIEERQLRTADRLERLLGVYAIVAWRLLWLTYRARLTPDAPCSLVLETHEWQALYCYIHKTSTPPDTPPTLRQAVRWIAQLGGFLGRASDGDPGVKVLWRGLQRLHDIATTWSILHPPPRNMGNA